MKRTHPRNLSSSFVAEFEANVNHFFELQNLLKKINSQKEEIERTLADLESQTIHLVEQGYNSTPNFFLKVRTSERRYPSWKDAFVEHAGHDAAKDVVDRTLPRFYKSLIISINGQGLKTGASHDPKFDDVA